MVDWQPGWVLPSAPSGPSVPDTALTFGGDPLTYGGDFLVFGTPTNNSTSPDIVSWAQGWNLPAI